jgi:hypothetical protein
MDDSSPHSPLPKPPQATGFRRLVVMLAIVVAVAAVALVLRSSRPPRPAPAPPAGDAVDVPEDSVARALRLAGVDSTKKNEWVDEIPDVDLAGLSPRQAEVFIRAANARHCTCGCGFTLAACRRFDSTCETSGPRVEALLDSVTRGLVTDARGLRERPSGSAQRDR